MRSDSQAGISSAGTTRPPGRKQKAHWGAGTWRPAQAKLSSTGQQKESRKLQSDPGGACTDLDSQRLSQHHLVGPATSAGMLQSCGWLPLLLARIRTSAFAALRMQAPMSTEQFKV
ncbi:unnamed protein product [Effrenium voratum]|nr:unnamed protein product [Effrenium voratum]